jgi:hypothetical protein
MNITPTSAAIGTCSINRLSATTNSRITTAVTTPLSRPRPPELVLISVCPIIAQSPLPLTAGRGGRAIRVVHSGTVSRQAASRAGVRTDGFKAGRTCGGKTMRRPAARNARRRERTI